MNTDSCDMIRMKDEEQVENGPPGSFCIDTLEDGLRVMWHKLPDGNFGCIRLRPIPGSHSNASPSWQWNGNEEVPTLSPSVHLPGRWHGWFRNGRMESC